MKVPKNLIVPIVAGIVIVVGAAILLSGSGKNFGAIGASKDSCDYRFFEWCKDYPTGGVDYDNFASANRECVAQGSYRTCDQVNDALG
ncbi:MAG: hypothetical protein HYS62_01825 [Candidatus Aenigmarchaeota archaeon]|nr:hypothetical protein [Candidatus Aenigmarchaeota archaeon]